MKDFQSADGLYTLLPNDVQLRFVIGQRTELSFYDSKLINNAYCNGLSRNRFLHFTVVMEQQNIYYEE